MKTLSNGRNQKHCGQEDRYAHVLVSGLPGFCTLVGHLHSFLVQTKELLVLGVVELDPPTVGQAADDYTANRSNNKNWSVGCRDNCIWQTNEQAESDSDKPARPRRQLDERDY